MTKSFYFSTEVLYLAKFTLHEDNTVTVSGWKGLESGISR